MSSISMPFCLLSSFAKTNFMTWNLGITMQLKMSAEVEVGWESWADAGYLIYSFPPSGTRMSIL